MGVRKMLEKCCPNRNGPLVKTIEDMDIEPYPHWKAGFTERILTRLRRRRPRARCDPVLRYALDSAPLSNETFKRAVTTAHFFNCRRFVLAADSAPDVSAVKRH